jgi:hypothetical protein
VRLVKYLRISSVKAWQIFTVGIAVLIAAVLLPSYEGILAGLAAVVMVAVVIVGFLLRPRREVFYLRTTQIFNEPDDIMSVEHDRVAVRVEIARLWLLFPPTMVAIAFLLVTSAHGTTWNFSFLDKLLQMPSYSVFLMIRILLLAVVGILSTWVSECWVLLDAEATTADSISTMAGRLLYSFRDRSGGYYGGEGFPFDLVKSSKLRKIVFYRASNPQLSKIAMACLFHRVVIVGRGVTDLDEATVSARSVQPVAQTH